MTFCIISTTNFQDIYCQMKIIITGATGLIGKSLCENLVNRGDEITVFTRNIINAKQSLTGIKNFVEWDYMKPAEWKNEICGKNAVIHLAGTNLFARRWNKNFKDEILKSREISTKNLVSAICQCENKPASLIVASGINYYGDCGENTINESNESGNDFLSRVCKVWEDEAAKVESCGVRQVSIRTGIVLSSEEGALKQMLLPFKLFVGGPIGNGKQWFPWIHIEDLVNSYIYSLGNQKIKGPVNGVSPDLVRMSDFTNTFGKILRRPSFLKVPLFVLKMAVGEFAEPITMSIKAIPEKLEQNNFTFKYSKLHSALKDLLK
jgi:uncharacterized protein (TIGR01777 family)